MTENKLWMRIFGAGFLLMVVCFCVSILRSPEELKGGVYTRLGEYQISHLKAMEVQRQYYVNQNKGLKNEIEVLHAMLRGAEEILLKEKL